MGQEINAWAQETGSLTAGSGSEMVLGRYLEVQGAICLDCRGLKHTGPSGWEATQKSGVCSLVKLGQVWGALDFFFQESQ